MITNLFPEINFARFSSDYITIDLNNFNKVRYIYISPFTTFPVWIPLDLMPVYNYLYRTKKDILGISLYFSAYKDEKKTASIISKYFYNFTDSIYGKYKIADESIFIGCGCILSHTFSPYIRTYVHITDWDSTYEHLIYDKAKVIIDKNIFITPTVVNKFIKNTLFSAYLKNDFSIEIDDYSSVDVLFQNIKQPTLMDKDENVYKILSNNINKCFK